MGLFVGLDVCVGDFLFGVDGVSISNYGEVWDNVGNVSLDVVDVLSGLDWGGSVILNVLCCGGVLKDVLFRYSELRGVGLGELRLLDNVLDASVLGVEVLCVKGVSLKPLRLDDVVHYNMLNYMGDEHAHKFRIMVSNIESHSAAYHAKSIRPGDILHKLNGKAIPSNWKEFAEMVNEHPEDKPLHIHTESNKIIIL